MRGGGLRLKSDRYPDSTSSRGQTYVAKYVFGEFSVSFPPYQDLVFVFLPFVRIALAIR
jgi:hypothetical protein